MHDRDVNVRLASGKTVLITGVLSPSTRMGVTADQQPTADAPVVITSGLSGSGAAMNFFSDAPDYAIGMNRAGEAILGIPANVTIDDGIAQQTETTACGGVWASPDCDIPSFAGWQVDGHDAFIQPGELIDIAGDLTITAAYDVIPVFGTPDFTLPENLAAVAAEAFEGIAASIVDVPVNCASIGDRAFRNCPNLTQIRIPAGCEMGTNVCDGCTQVYVFGAAGSPAEAYCQSHSNCAFVPVE